MNVTFIGLGIMGSRMAARLLDGGVRLTVYNRTPDKTRALCKAGARTFPRAGAAVKDADVVFSMLSHPQAVRELFLEQGCLGEISPGAAWVDFTTVNPSFSRLCAREAGRRGVRFFDVPVAGTKPHAEKGELVFFAGGAREVPQNVRSLLLLMGKKVLSVGETGMGSAFKMLVNMMLAQSMLAYGEALMLGEKMGLSADFLFEILPTLPVSAPFIRSKAPRIREGVFETEFPLEWMHKDLLLALQTAEELGQKITMARQGEKIFDGARNQGLARHDFSAVYRYLKQEDE